MPRCPHIPKMEIIVDNIYRLNIEDSDLREEFLNKALVSPVVDNVSYCYLGDKNEESEKAWTYHAILLKVRSSLDNILHQEDIYPLQIETISVLDSVYKIVFAKMQMSFRMRKPLPSGKMWFMRVLCFTDPHSSVPTGTIPSFLTNGTWTAQYMRTLTCSKRGCSQRETLPS